MPVFAEASLPGPLGTGGRILGAGRLLWKMLCLRTVPGRRLFGLGPAAALPPSSCVDCNFVFER